MIFAAVCSYPINSLIKCPKIIGKKKTYEAFILCLFANSDVSCVIFKRKNKSTDCVQADTCHRRQSIQKSFTFFDKLNEKTKRRTV